MCAHKSREGDSTVVVVVLNLYCNTRVRKEGEKLAVMLAVKMVEKLAEKLEVIRA